MVDGEGELLTLAKQDVAAGAKSLRFDNLDRAGRITALRIKASNGNCEIERVVVTYANGQVHYEDRPIPLNERGRRSMPIDPRIEGRLVQAVELSLKPGSCTDKVTLEVLGARLAGVVPARKAGRRAIIQEDTGPPASTAPSPPDQTKSAAPTTAGEPPKFSEVDIFFGTTRKEEARRKRETVTMASFGSTPHPDGLLSLGKAVVTVPLQGRSSGQLNRPEFRILSMSYEAEDTSRHFTLLQIDVLEQQAFIDAAKRNIKATGRFKDHAFVFVHGFNVSFDDALFRAAQLSFDMEFDGLAFVFSWPSRANVAGYILDKDRAAGARQALGRFVEHVRGIMGGPAGTKNIHFIGHSMGSQPLMEALSDYRKPAGETAPLFGQVIFAASDVAQLNFKTAIANIAQTARGITLYASSKDWALTVSKFPRLGELPVGLIASDGTPFAAPGFDSIDVSSLDTDFFARNHSTYSDRKVLIEDMQALFASGTRPPSARNGAFKEQPLPGRSGSFWRFAP